VVALNVEGEDEYVTAVEPERLDDFVCEACDTTFSSEEELVEHSVEMHGAPRKKSSEGTQTSLD